MFLGVTENKLKQSGLWVDNKYLSYRLYLKSDHWQRMREMLLAERGMRCEKCHKPQSFVHVHHLNYDRLGAELTSDLMITCRICHDKIHRESRVNRPPPTVVSPTVPVVVKKLPYMGGKMYFRKYPANVKYEKC